MKFRNDLVLFTITYNTIMIKSNTQLTNVLSHFDNYFKSYSFSSNTIATKKMFVRVINYKYKKNLNQII